MIRACNSEEPEFNRVPRRTKFIYAELLKSTTIIRAFPISFLFMFYYFIVKYNNAARMSYFLYSKKTSIIREFASIQILEYIRQYHFCICWFFFPFLMCPFDLRISDIRIPNIMNNSNNPNIWVIWIIETTPNKTNNLFVKIL